ncbi:MAG: DUF1573 domain-containing protein [Planctomycetota bacterium]|jgi:hypothetical protein
MKRNSQVLAGAVVCCAWFCLVGCAKKLGSAQEPETVRSTLTPAAGPDREVVVQPDLGKNAPKISFEQVVYDFGDVDPKSRNVCEFKFTNVGGALLKIAKVDACCGFKADLKDDKKAYAPGEGGAVIVQFGSARFRGSLTKYQYVHSNDGNSPRVRLTVKANIVVKVRHQPRELRLALRGENAACPEISLVSIDDQAFAISSFTSTGNCIHASYDREEQATSFVLQPRVDVEKLKKNPSGHVRIVLTHPGCDTVVIPFKVLPEFQVNPGSIIVRDAEPRKPIRRVVWVLNNYGDDFEIESASSREGIVEVVGREKYGTRYKFELEITPPPIDGKMRVFSDVFSVSIKGGGKLRVDCRGFYSSKTEGR